MPFSPMPFSMSRASLPVFAVVLDVAGHLLAKAEAYATEKKIDPAVLLAWRLAPDMFPLLRQFQIVTDLTKNGAGRLAGVTPPRFEDTEKTFADMKARLDRTAAFIKTLDAAAIDAAIDTPVTFPIGPDHKGRMIGADYLNHFVLPNVYFHLTVAYAILRSLGLDIGKLDYLGNIPITRT
ncbi:DUF1993 domain-containing protein [Xanthobacteraceae bacterium Astr-EGSB]|uniref:DUF1993 domain-containing protein n=1 Tax=Astrobacterium formosum TaxID=3069710 RepID=UPI0027B56AFB|nr:DUF1993 domain-containing protein [Xanthobacteraceae bacterium Astr-EGSB]